METLRRTLRRKGDFTKAVAKLRKVAKSGSKHGQFRNPSCQSRTVQVREIDKRRKRQLTPASFVVPFTFTEFVQLRKKIKLNHDSATPCKDSTGWYVLDRGFVSNLNRMHNPGSIELKKASGTLQRHEDKIGLIFAHRHLSSPKNGCAGDGVGGPNSLSRLMFSSGMGSCSMLCASLHDDDPEVRGVAERTTKL